MHTIIAAAAVWQFEDRLSEANCFCGGPFFVGAPVWSNMLNMPKSASGSCNVLLKKVLK